MIESKGLLHQLLQLLNETVQSVMQQHVGDLSSEGLSQSVEVHIISQDVCILRETNKQTQKTSKFQLAQSHPMVTKTVDDFRWSSAISAKRSYG